MTTSNAAVALRSRSNAARVFQRAGSLAGAEGAGAGWGRVAASVAWRWGCFAAMTALAVWNEARPGTKIADPLLDLMPYVPWIERWNYWIWLLAWLPWLLVLLVLDRGRFVRLMVSAGWVSLLRGVSIVLTGLGPVRGEDVNAALHWDAALYRETVLRILDPIGVFGADGARIWLTKDLFFSGHAASTFLLLLYVWRFSPLRIIVLTLHVVVVASVLLGEVHYTIDVLGGWAAAAAVYVLRERSARVTSRRSTESAPAASR